MTHALPKLQNFTPIFILLFHPSEFLYFVYSTTSPIIYTSLSTTNCKTLREWINTHPHFIRTVNLDLVKEYFHY